MKTNFHETHIDQRGFFLALCYSSGFYPDGGNLDFATRHEGEIIRFLPTLRGVRKAASKLDSRHGDRDERASMIKLMRHNARIATLNRLEKQRAGARAANAARRAARK